MAVHHPELMKPAIREAFEAFLLAWGFRLNELAVWDIIPMINSYYKDQLLTLELTRRGQKIVLPPARLN